MRGKRDYGILPISGLGIALEQRTVMRFNEWKIHLTTREVDLLYMR